MKPTDEDVEATAAIAVNAMNGKHGLAKKWPEGFTEEQRQNLSDFLRYALEAYTPRLIEKLAREAEGKCSHVDCGPCRQGDKTAKFLRSHLEEPDDT